ncbi:Hypothetical predicted protein, partial [Paramuricea clavata]
IKRYCERSMISKKLNGFVDRYNTTLLLKDGKHNEDDQYVSMSSPLRNIENFLECLTNADKDGRIFIDNQEKTVTSTSELVNVFNDYLNDVGPKLAEKIEYEHNYCTNEWYINMDRGLYNIVVLLDLKKAFDTVNHEILLRKFERYGFGNKALDLLSNYLTNRTQRCQLNGMLSDQ